ncbi:glycosyltransferase family 39 protein [Pedobacter jejuensis]|uniref:Glycosyl transferase n=1 Tax=Pedobacter jejuensis TaxID=1268550 RepID=A0A3N0BNF9_9SPHI|nr:glycosyltransferase family 39 protein [Pedobacter jejuensis]RNL50246.1 glycosyl transferase [Pedobacter jejuensis]
MKNSNSLLIERASLIGFVLLKFILSYALVNSVYELHRDEFLHLDQANHLAAGFTSVPPLTSLFSLLIKFLGNGVFWVRFIPTLFGALTMVFGWLIVGKLKGNLFAKCLLAVSFIFSAYLRTNILYQPNSFDVLAWTAIFYYLISYFENNKPKYLYAFAIWIALGFLNKYNVMFLVFGLLPAIIATPNRTIFTNRLLYFAILLALIIISPNVIWQINHNFPVISHMQELAETQLVHVKRFDFFKEQVLFFITDIFVLIAAFVGFTIYKPFRKHIWVILTYIFTLTIFSYFNAKAYYALGLYPVLLAFGSVFISLISTKKYALRTLIFVFTIGMLIYITPIMMPVYSPAKIIENHNRFERVGALRWEDGENHNLPQDFADMQGWKELAHLTDIAYAKVKDKSAVVVRTDNYGQAGAINYYSKFKNINAVSYNADYLYWFKMDKPIKDLILVREINEEDPQRKKEQPFFEKIIKIGEIKNPYAREKGTAVFLLQGANIDINSRLQAEIKERKHDH